MIFIKSHCYTLTYLFLLARFNFKCFVNVVNVIFNELGRPNLNIISCINGNKVRFVELIG